MTCGHVRNSAGRAHGLLSLRVTANHHKKCPQSLDPSIGGRPKTNGASTTPNRQASPPCSRELMPKRPRLRRPRHRLRPPLTLQTRRRNRRGARRSSQQFPQRPCLKGCLNRAPLFLHRAVGASRLGSLLESLLFGVESRDTVTLTVAALVLLLVTMVACLIPARRATRVDPMAALRLD